jgi:type IV secretory pathway VirJ component
LQRVVSAALKFVADQTKSVGPIALALIMVSIIPASSEVIDGGRYGQVRLALPDRDIHGFVIYFSDGSGWNGDDDAAMSAIAHEGAVTVGVDTKSYMSAVAVSGKACDQLVGDAETLSRQLQRLHPGSQYTFPIVAGHGEGGTLAYVVLTQAPANTLAGAASLDPTTDLWSGIPLCRGSDAKLVAPGRYRYGPKKVLDGFFAIGLGGGLSAEVKDYVADLVKAGAPVELQNMTAEARAEDIAYLIAPHLHLAESVGVAALPLIEMPAKPSSKLMAVVLAGDGGWRDVDKAIAEALQERGVSVVGWDSLKYFWREKSPAQTAADLTATVDEYSRKWGADKVALIGYSFGADVLPIVYDLLPEAVKQKIVLMTFLGLESKADWEITVSGWLGEHPSDRATYIAPALAAMPVGLVQCFYGVEEPESACPTLAPDQAELIKTSGGHHFGHDVDGVVDKIMAGFHKRAGT